MSNGDPAVIEKRGKSNAARKGRYDGSYTGTEQRMKDRLMRQFMRTGEGGGGNSEAYRNASCWCECGKLILRDGLCAKCWETIPLGEHPLSESVTHKTEHGSVTVMSDPRMEGRTPLLFQPGAVPEIPEPYDADRSLWRRTGRQ